MYTVGGEKRRNAERKVLYLKKEYPFLKEDQQEGNVSCAICKLPFSIKHGGRSNVLKHNNKGGKKHVIAVSSKSCSRKVKSYFTKRTIIDGHRNTAANGQIVLTIKYKHSSQSTSYTPSVTKIMYEQKFTRGRTKHESVAVNVFASAAMQHIL
jgi:hypothetical protein